MAVAVVGRSRARALGTAAAVSPTVAAGTSAAGRTGQGAHKRALASAPAGAVRIVAGALDQCCMDRLPGDEAGTEGMGWDRNTGLMAPDPAHIMVLLAGRAAPTTGAEWAGRYWTEARTQSVGAVASALEVV